MSLDNIVERKVIIEHVGERGMSLENFGERGVIVLEGIVQICYH